MRYTLHVDPADAVPIWRQIEDGVRRLVATGALVPGGPVPSVRDLARQLQVNPATVSKAYRRLTDAGVLEVRRGEGTFVTASPPALSNGDRHSELSAGAVRYAALARTLGADYATTTDELARAWHNLEKGAHHD